MRSVLSYRGNLFLLTYLLFPVNVLIGVLLAVWRMIITALFNIVHMGRMDISLLNRNVEAFDPGEPDILQPVQINTAIVSLCGMLTKPKHQVKFNVIMHLTCTCLTCQIGSGSIIYSICVRIKDNIAVEINAFDFIAQLYFTFSVFKKNV